MPIHDWSRVEPGIFHDFHQAWTVAIMDALNIGGLPHGYFAMIAASSVRECANEQALEWRPKGGGSRPVGTGVAVADDPPRARFITSADIDPYEGNQRRGIKGGIKGVRLHFWVAGLKHGDNNTHERRRKGVRLHFEGDRTET